MPPEFRNIEPPSTWTIFPRHPLSEEYEDLTAPLAKKMYKGIKEYGIMLRSIVLKREQGGLAVLDGWQMYQGAIKADVKPTFVELVSGIEPKKFVEIFNDYRRHETLKARAKRLKIRKATIKADVASGTPVAEAARKLGISRTTAHADLKSPDPKPLPRCERCERLNTTGDDCARCQLLRMDMGEQEEEEAAEEPSKEEPPPPPLLDANFVTVPEKAIEAFEVAAELASMCHDIDQIAKKLGRIIAKKVGARSISPTAAQRFTDIRQHLWQARPTHVCAYCQGNNPECEACQGQGWQPGHQFQQAPTDMQDAMRAMGAKNVPI